MWQTQNSPWKKARGDFLHSGLLEMNESVNVGFSQVPQFSNLKFILPHFLQHFAREEENTQAFL